MFIRVQTIQAITPANQSLPATTPNTHISSTILITTISSTIALTITITIIPRLIKTIATCPDNTNTHSSHNSSHSLPITLHLKTPIDSTPSVKVHNIQNHNQKSNHHNTLSRIQIIAPFINKMKYHTFVLLASSNHFVINVSSQINTTIIKLKLSKKQSKSSIKNYLY